MVWEKREELRIQRAPCRTREGMKESESCMGWQVRVGCPTSEVGASVS